MKHEPAVSIVIPTYNHLNDCLRPCVESVMRHTSLASTELIVSANGCTDGTRDYLSGLVAGREDRVKAVWSDEPLGYARAVNAGLRVAAGDLIVLLNNDTVLLDQPTDAWLRVLEVPFVLDSVAVTGPLDGVSPAGRKFLVFFCAMLRKAALEKIGLLDEGFEIGGGEDMDWCHRAEDAGYKAVRVPENVPTEYDGNRMVGYFPIFHQAEATIRGISEHSLTYKRNLLKLLSKYPNDAARKRLNDEIDSVLKKQEADRVKGAGS